MEIVKYESKRPSVPTGNFQIGGRRCNFQCPYCISEMTSTVLDNGQFKRLWYRNFDIALSTFKNYNVNTVLITSKGEPLLWLDETFKSVSAARDAGFIVELQTNGSLLNEANIDALVDSGLSTVAISRVSVFHNTICGPGAEINTRKVVEMCVAKGLNVRLTFIVMKGHNDTYANVMWTCKTAEGLGASQVTLRRMGMPDVENLADRERARKIYTFVDKNKISRGDWLELARELNNNNTLMRTFDWGSASWYVEGVECLMADCLTIPGPQGTIRYLIYCPDGHMRYSWEHENAIIF